MRARDVVLYLVGLGAATSAAYLAFTAPLGTFPEDRVITAVVLLGLVYIGIRAGWAHASARAARVLGLERVRAVTKSARLAGDPASAVADMERETGKVALGALAALFWAGTLMLGWILVEGYRPGSVFELGGPWVQVLIVGLAVGCAAYATFVTVQWRRAVKGA